MPGFTIIITQFQMLTWSWEDSVGHSAQGTFEEGMGQKGILINVLGAYGGHADLQWIPDQPENHMVQEKMQAAWVIDAKHPRHESSANKPEVLIYSQILMESHSS